MVRSFAHPLRLLFAVVLLTSAGSLLSSYATTATAVDVEGRINGSDPGAGPIPSDAALTVVSTQGFYVTGERADLVAFTDSGRIVFHNRSYGAYFDVDPVSGTRYTVEYVAAEYLPGSYCSRTRCTRNVVERVNLSSGETDRVYAAITPGVPGTRWHDVDRLNDTHLVVADITNDRVTVVDTRTGEATWTWSARDVFRFPEGGGDPNDWTHLNDVEVLADGRIMVSLRNFDRVVFLDPGRGLVANWTLGAENDHGTLFEQHNPDYIPATRGGPAVLVADSENNRVLEYRREGGTWKRGWTWRDRRLQWPRDADRLPNGNTLIVDSHGDRVLEVTPRGRTVWNVTVGMPYDAERLGTGDESAGGRALSGATERTGWITDDPSVRDDLLLALKTRLSGPLLNGLLYLAPEWVRFGDLLLLGVVLLDALAWGAFEARRGPLRRRRG
ncbi:MAG: aryl-sulfate sulfotransferase [Halobacteriales archaeon]